MNSEAVEIAEIEVDIEDYAKRNEKPPHARRYRLRIDKTPYVVETPIITGKELLTLAGKTPETHKLYQILRGSQPTPLAPEAKVDLRTQGIERFTTVPRDPTEGLSTATATELRREFSLGETDQEYLDNLGVDWEAIKEGGSLWLLLQEWHLPSGYSIDKASLALRIPESYPDAEIDMVYFFPGLSRTDAIQINNLSDLVIDKKTYQQWSRHRTGANPWKPAEDDISSHLSLVDDWLRREFSGK